MLCTCVCVLLPFTWCFIGYCDVWLFNDVFRVYFHFLAVYRCCVRCVWVTRYVLQWCVVSEVSAIYLCVCR